jgi:hypothetical protein
MKLKYSVRTIKTTKCNQHFAAPCGALDAAGRSDHESHRCVDLPHTKANSPKSELGVS